MNCNINHYVRGRKSGAGLATQGRIEKYRVAVHNGERSETSPGMALLDRTHRKAIKNMVWSVGCEVGSRERRGPEGQIQNKCKLVIDDESREARTT